MDLGFFSSEPPQTENDPFLNPESPSTLGLLDRTFIRHRRPVAACRRPPSLGS